MGCFCLLVVDYLYSLLVVGYGLLVVDGFHSLLFVVDVGYGLLVVGYGLLTIYIRCCCWLLFVGYGLLFVVDGSMTTTAKSKARDVCNRQ